MTIWRDSLRDVDGTDLDSGSNGLNTEGVLVVPVVWSTDAMVDGSKTTLVSFELKYDRDHCSTAPTPRVINESYTIPPNSGQTDPRCVGDLEKSLQKNAI